MTRFSPLRKAMSVYVVRAFVRLREAAVQHKDLAQRLASLEEKTDHLATQYEVFSRNTRNQLRQVFDALRELTTTPDPPKRPIGFVTPEDKKDKPGKPASATAKVVGKKV